MNLGKFTTQYIATALWSSTDESTPEGGEPLDKNYTIDDLSFEALEQAREDCRRFLEMSGDVVYTYDTDQAGHDFWLTRNGHGAGFWDGDYLEEDGKLLTEISKIFGECYLYVGDDGKLHF